MNGQIVVAAGLAGALVLAIGRLRGRSGARDGIGLMTLGWCAILVTLFAIAWLFGLQHP